MAGHTGRIHTKFVFISTCHYYVKSVLLLLKYFAEIFSSKKLEKKYDPLCSHMFELLALINLEMSLCSVN